MRALREADVVLLAGCRVSSWLWDGSNLRCRPAGGQHVIHLDVDPSAAAGVLPAGRWCSSRGQHGRRSARYWKAVGEAPVKAEPASWLRVARRGAPRAPPASCSTAPTIPADAMHPVVLAAGLGDWLPEDAWSPSTGATRRSGAMT